ncbi:MAG: DUF1330 domain-containing protein [Pseudomonadota bacterium]
MSSNPTGALMLIQATITDPKKFAGYASRTPQVVEKFGGRYIAMRSETAVLEGDDDPRHIVVSAWPSLEAARAFWDSPEYAAVKPFRENAADVQVTLIECNDA